MAGALDETEPRPRREGSAGDIGGADMRNIIYLIGLVVVVLVILSLVGIV